MTEKDHLDCAVEMLRGLKAGKSPHQIKRDLLKSGYTQKQIAEAGDALIKAS